jgi:hypothetical protein
MSAPPPELPDLLRLHGKRRPLWVRALCLAGAVVFFFLGLVGWLIPFVTGIPFYLVAIALLGMASDRVIVWINRLDRKLPYRWRGRLRRGLGKLPKGIRRFVRLRDDSA